MTAWAERPVFRAAMHIGPARLLRLVAGLWLFGALALTIVVSRPDLLRPADLFTDASNYYAAGDRLAQGREMYEQLPGDRPTPLDNEPFWSAPLLSPPGVGVVWRGLAGLPPGVAMEAWSLAGTLAMVALAVVLLLGGTAPVVLTVIILTPYLAIVAWSGNLNALLVPAFALVWRLADHQTGRFGPVAAGLIVAFGIWLKLTAVFIGWWFLVAGHRRAAAWSVGWGMVVGVVGVAGSSVTAHLDYLAVSAQLSSAGATALSFPGLVRDAGAPDLATFAIPVLSIVLAAAMVALRRRPSWAFVLAIVGTTLMTPALRPEVTAGLLAAAAPWIRTPDGLPTRSSAPRAALIPATPALVAAAILVTGMGAVVLARNVPSTTVAITNTTTEPVIVRLATVAGTGSIGWIIEPGSSGWAFRDEPGGITARLAVARTSCTPLREQVLFGASSLHIRVGSTVAVDEVVPDIAQDTQPLARDRRCTELFGEPRA